MKFHDLRVWPSSETRAREEELAWQLSELAFDSVPVDEDVLEMIANRIIDNASVATASLLRAPVAAARQQALAHPRAGGATLYGLPQDCRVAAEWAALANGTAVRELDYHDTYLAEEYSHPGDNIPPLLAVAQQTGRSGSDLVHGIATAYEVQINLVKAVSLHKHTSRPRRGSRARDKYRVGRHTHRDMRRNLLSKPLIELCAARRHLRQSTRVRTVSSPGYLTARTPITAFRCLKWERQSGLSWRVLRRSILPSIKRKLLSIWLAGCGRKFLTLL